MALMSGMGYRRGAKFLSPLGVSILGLHGAWQATDVHGGRGELVILQTSLMAAG